MLCQKSKPTSELWKRSGSILVDKPDRVRKGSNLSVFFGFRAQ